LTLPRYQNYSLTFERQLTNNMRLDFHTSPTAEPPDQHLAIPGAWRQIWIQAF